MRVLHRIETASVYYDVGLEEPSDGLELDVVWRRCNRCNEWWVLPTVAAPAFYGTCAPCLIEERRKALE